MKEHYQTILSRYIDQGGEPDLELAYDFGRQAINEGIGVLDVVDTHYEALADVLLRANSIEQCNEIAQRAASLLKEALGPFEMTRQGYSETIARLRQQNEKLTDLMNEKAKLLKQREDIMMVVTHDLKTPIIAADKCLNFMLDGTFGQFTQEQIEVISVMQESNQRMFTMVKNLLEVYRYDQTTPMLNLTRVAVDQLLRAMVKSFALAAQMRGLALELVLPDDVKPVRADENALQHVLTNLLDNATKFTSKGGTITLSAQNLDGQVGITVQDTGKGISAEDLPRLFHRFFQSDSGKKKYTGTGLGLYLCQQIITAHGGDIECHSELNVGTTFSVNLPVFIDA